MIVELWVQAVTLKKKVFSQVPKLLKEKVKERLIDNGHEKLI